MQLIIDIVLFLIYLGLFLLICSYIWKFWMLYVNQKYLNDLKWVMLEIKIPREIFKSPEAMEIALNALLQGGGVGNFYNRNIQGRLPSFFSLEIESDQGEIHFYIRTETKYRQLIQNNLYSQYPGIEVIEAPDYTTKVFYDHRVKDVSLWGITYKTTNKFKIKKGDMKEAEDIKGDFLPIRTYKDFRLDKDPKEEYKIDPITPVLEWLGSLRKGEYGWYQIVVQDTSAFNDKRFPKTYRLESTHEHFDMVELAKERLNQIRKFKDKQVIKAGTVVKDDYGNVRTMPNPKFVEGGAEPRNIPLTYAEDKEISAGYDTKENELREEEKTELIRITDKLQKPLVRAVMRVMYLKDDKNSTGDFLNNIQSTLSLFKQYTYPSYNGFATIPAAGYEYAWQNTKKRREPWRREEFYEAFVEREGFYPHMEERKGIDKFFDVRFFNTNLGFRKKFRMLWEAFFYPFDHPHPEDVFTLNLEELATLYHLPGQVATTPGLDRIDSVKVDAPGNLPI